MTVAAARLGGAVRALATLVLVAVGGLVVWTLLPLAVGWNPHVVLTGSMEPRIRVGDVVVAQPSGTASPGQVVLARAPWAGGQVVAHRVDAVLADGSLVTRGDANQSVDPAPLPPGSPLSVARLRVPLVGWPFVWVDQGRLWPAFGAVAAVSWATLAVTKPPRPVSPRRPRRV